MLLRWLSLLLIFSVLLSLPVAAQETRGTILGRVSDPSGAVIPAADIRATNVATGVSAAAKSNEFGNFVLPYLIPGIYNLTAELAGFKKFVQDGIQVRINDSVEVNIEMQVGNVSESVEVKAATPLLSTSESSLGQVVDERRVLELPLMAGNALDLVHLAPGTINGTDMRLRKAAWNAAPSQFSTDGSGNYGNEFTIDGVSNTFANGTSGMRVAFAPPQTAIGEFKVQTTSFDASIGHSSGALVNVSSKGGTNEFHGEAHEWLRHSKLDAPTIFQNRAGQKLFLYQDNRYGLSGGAPVRIPGLYNGKNKTFWYYAWEANKYGDPMDGQYTNTVPTDAMRRGDLSDLLAIGPNYQVYDPATTVAVAGGHYSRVPLAGNIIPPSRLDPVALKLLDLWPKPNQQGTRDGLNNHFYSGKALEDYWVHMGRFDHAFSENHRLFVRLHKDWWEEDMQRRFGLGNIANGVISNRTNRGIALDEVYVFNPAFLFNFRYGLTQQDFPERRPSRGFDLASLGFSPNLTNLVDKKLATIPNTSVGSLTALAGWSAGDGLQASLTHSFTGNFTRLYKDHELRFGSEFRVYRAFRNRFPYDVSPQLSFSSSYTRGPSDTSTAPPVGGELTSFLLGIPGGQMARSASYAEQDKYFALYLQDDFKVTRKLTLNLGLRYELEAPVTERFDRSVAHFAFDKPSPIEAQAKLNYAKSPIPELPVDQFHAMGGLTFVNVDGNPRTFWSGSRHNFMPRVGFAWQILPKTVLRSGYGLFFDSIGVNRTDSIQTGYSQTTPIQASLDNGLTFIAKTADPFPSGLTPPLGAAGGLATYLGQSVSFFPVERRRPYAQRWSFGLQQQLPMQFLVEASYVGSRATRLGVSRNLNFLPAQYLSRLPVRDTATINYLSASFPSPFYGLKPIYGTTMSRSSLLVPYPQFGSVSVEQPIGYSWYHSLQVRGEKRLSQGYTFQLGYTWSKFMQATEFLNASDPMPYRTISDLDRTHRLVVSAIWELPFGRGKSLGGNWPVALNSVAGGWQLNAVVQRQSGPPLGFGNAIFTGNPDDINLPKDQRNTDRWFNTEAGFNRNSAQQLSNNIRTFPLRFSGVRGDGQARWDFSAIKNFRVHEKARLQFRAECYNAWNHPNLSTPSTSATSSSFGRITSQNAPRSWQGALKLTF